MSPARGRRVTSPVTRPCPSDRKPALSSCGPRRLQRAGVPFRALPDRPRPSGRSGSDPRTPRAAHSDHCTRALSGVCRPKRTLPESAAEYGDLLVGGLSCLVFAGSVIGTGEHAEDVQKDDVFEETRHCVLSRLSYQSANGFHYGSLFDSRAALMTMCAASSFGDCAGFVTMRAISDSRARRVVLPVHSPEVCSEPVVLYQTSSVGFYRHVRPESAATSISDDRSSGIGYSSRSRSREVPS